MKNSIRTRNKTNLAINLDIASTRTQTKTSYDKKHKIAWAFMNADNHPPYLSEGLLDELNDYYDLVKQEMESSNQQKYDYLVLASDREDIFNQGEDLKLIYEATINKDKQKLLSYAKRCVDILYQTSNNLDSDLTTIALVKADAIGSGFELALSSSLIIAEKGAKFGMSSALFNLFPGIGGYSLLANKIGPSLARKICTSGQLYSAESLYDFGVIDILAEKGQAELALSKLVKGENNQVKQQLTLNKLQGLTSSIKYNELLSIAELWVEYCLGIKAKDVRMMERLLMRQSLKNATQFH